MLINNQIDLNSLCTKLKNEKSLAIDTEFVRKSTYYPKLSIIQICTTNNQIYILDAIALDISPFNEILQNETIVKIIHSPLQDFENFYIHFKSIPVNIFDTQIAAKFCGFRANSSYSELCKAICRVDIDKTHQLSDWLQRPLPDAMLEYAKKDVEHLHAIYYKLLSQITDYQQYEIEIKKLLDIENYKLNPELAWKKIKSPGYFKNETSYYALREIAAFREEMAATLDVPRSHFLSDEAVISLCKTLPTKNSEFSIHKQKTNWINNDKYREKLFNLCAAIKLECRLQGI